VEGFDVEVEFFDGLLFGDDVESALSQTPVSQGCRNASEDRLANNLLKKLNNGRMQMSSLRKVLFCSLVLFIIKLLSRCMQTPLQSFQCKWIA
jgi:hypothetical protein